MFKRIVAPLVLPMPLGLALMLVGLALLWFTKRQKAGKILVSVGVLLYTILACGPLSDVLVGRLESEYLPLIPNNQRAVDANVKWVVVLGGGHTLDPRLPSLSQLSSPSLGRLVEGIRVYREYPGSKLILSGGTSVGYPLSVAEVMAGAAETLGVAPADIVLESESKNTEDEARLIRPMVGQDPFIVVTSASHMPRAMALFKKLEMNPIPAPADYIVKQGPVSGFPWGLYPNAERLARADRALHEYLGIIWADLRGAAD